MPSIGDIPDFKVEWLVEGFIPRGSVTILAGQPGSLKSWLALDATHRIATGAPFAGRVTRLSVVLYLGRENPAPVIRQRKAHLGIANPANLHYWGLWCKEAPAALTDPRLLDFATSGTAPVVIVDSLIRFHSGDENSATEMSAIMKDLRQVAAAGGTVIALVHKSDKSDNPYRGSSEILVGCDVLWSIEKREDRNTIELRGRKNRYAAESCLAIQLEAGGFISTVSERQRAGSTAIEMMIEIVRENPGLTQVKLLNLGQARGLSQKQVREALKKGPFAALPGERNSHVYYLSETAGDGGTALIV